MMTSNLNGIGLKIKVHLESTKQLVCIVEYKNFLIG